MPSIDRLRIPLGSARRSSSQICLLLAAIASIGLTACATVKQTPPPTVKGSALALRPVNDTVPVYLYLLTNDNFGISIKRDQIFGIAADGKEFAALSPDEAAERGRRG